jgi:hypothetical protein
VKARSSLLISVIFAAFVGSVSCGGAEDATPGDDAAAGDGTAQGHDGMSDATVLPDAGADASADDAGRADARRDAHRDGAHDARESDAREPDAQDDGAADAGPPEDASHADATDDAIAKSSFGDPCTSASECASGFCETVMMRLMCTVPCHAGTVDPICKAAGSSTGDCNNRGFCKP